MTTLVIKGHLAMFAWTESSMPLIYVMFHILHSTDSYLGRLVLLFQLGWSPKNVCKEVLLNSVGLPSELPHSAMWLLSHIFVIQVLSDPLWKRIMGKTFLHLLAFVLCPTLYGDLPFFSHQTILGSIPKHMSTMASDCSLNNIVPLWILM